MAGEIENKNARLAKILVLIVIGMFGFGYALVPLYNVLCDITGINGKAEAIAVKEANYAIDNSREILVEFTTTLNETTAMVFRPETKQLRVHPGKYYTVNFYAENKSGRNMEAQAIPSFSPGLTAQYFEKVECFCFKKQLFKPGEAKTMPMRFVIKPDLPKEYKIVTLSYTFFDNTKTVAQK